LPELFAFLPDDVLVLACVVNYLFLGDWLVLRLDLLEFLEALLLYFLDLLIRVLLLQLNELGLLGYLLGLLDHLLLRQVPLLEPILDLPLDLLPPPLLLLLTVRLVLLQLTLPILQLLAQLLLVHARLLKPTTLPLLLLLVQLRHQVFALLRLLNTHHNSRLSSLFTPVVVIRLRRTISRITPLLHRCCRIHQDLVFYILLQLYTLSHLYHLQLFFLSYKLFLFDELFRVTSANFELSPVNFEHLILVDFCDLGSNDF
jgi:hypothetical protein